MDRANFAGEPLRTRQRLSKFLFAIGVVCFGLAIWITFYFAQTGPVTPNVVTGQIHDMGYRERTVYLTNGEYWLLDGSLIAAAFFSITGLLVGRRPDP